MTDFITDPLRSERAPPTNYAEHVNPKSLPSALPVNLPRTIGHLRMLRVVFVRLLAPLLVSMRVDYPVAMIPQVLTDGAVSGLFASHRAKRFCSRR